MNNNSPTPHISLKSPVYEVSGVLKKTKAKFWSELKVGDKIQFQNTIKYVGGASNGLYATLYHVTVCGSSPEVSGVFSQNEVCRYLKMFNIKEA